MSLTAVIVGLPNVGTSTLFNAITKAGAEMANYPFATIDPNVGVVEVPDPRLKKLAEIFKPQKVIPTTFEFTDIAGLVKGASKGEGLGNKFLANIRQVDAICHVVRCFADENITHVAGKVDPIADIETINLELILADIETVEKRLTRVEKLAKQKDKAAMSEYEVLLKVKEAFEKELPARSVSFTEEELKIIKGYQLLTLKPVIYVANVGEDDISNVDANPYVQQVKEYAVKEGAEIVTICAKLEEEISQLDEEEKEVFLEELGIEESGLDQLIRKSYALLGLATFFTAGEKEVRAWTFKRGMKAPECAGIIHSDFERGFIRAETISYEDYDQYNGEKGARDAGRMRQEGKDYIVQDGDVMLFRFNV